MPDDSLAPMSRNSLNEPVRIVPSGYRHPYFVTTRDTEQTLTDDMPATITSYPSLGRWLVLPDTQRSVEFVVVLETDSEDVKEWQVDLFGGTDSSEWSATSLIRTEAVPDYSMTTPLKKYRYWFKAKSGHLDGDDFQFTFRFKQPHDADWKWARNSLGLEDGRLLFRSAEPYHADLSHYVEDFDATRLRAEKQSSDTPDTGLWVITGPAAPAKGEQSGWSRSCLGKVVDGQRWFALVRLMTPWLAPRHGRFLHELAKDDAILYSFLTKKGLHVVFLAVSGLDHVQTVLQHENGKLMAAARNDAEEQAPLYVVAAVGRSFDYALAAAVYKARSLVSPFSTSAAPVPPNYGSSDEVRTNWVQDWFDGFAYCTWNGLGKQLTEEKLSSALDSLKRHGVNVTNLIIDDNWQSLDREGESNMVQGWKEFEANPTGFPKGFSHAIRSLRQKHPDLQQIAVWHALLGYWGGISPEGKLAKQYRTRQVNVQRDAIIVDGSMLVIDPQDVAQMYDDFYAFLDSCTVSAVKADSQFALDELTSAKDRREMFSAYRSAWTTSHLRHLSGHAISCMSQTPYILFASQLPTNTPTILVRNSDDFFPTIEDSHPWHVYCNAYNAHFTKHLNALADWDMFQTSHPWASFHAASRCLSGGPIYITDKPDDHDVALIKQMTAQTSRGQTVILRPSVVGRSGDAYVGYDEDALLKIDAYNGAAMTGSSFSGFFNCRAWPLRQLVHLKEFLSVQEDVEYVVRAFRSERISPVLSPGDAKALLRIGIDAHSWEILTATPVTELTLPVEGTAPLFASVSVLGLISHMSGAAGLVSASAEVTPPDPTAQLGGGGTARHRIRVSTQLKALGTLGVWVSVRTAAELSKDSLLVLLEGRVVPAHTVRLDGVSPADVGGTAIVSVDLERAWREMGLEGTYSNEIKVDVFIGV